ncbi:UNVERIFIED_CONTAM: hypothetical protein PYX00_005653 [Menopon gallinae]|uniref:Nose resistant-to-fluoxetine protein N-terminal domain-containing protein n=1 Tax=Menopon gallinae TaxID=328185 RepID=A0AAW2HS75_9NEOP
MRICALHILWQIFLLSFLTIHFVNETDAKLGHVGWAKSDSRTKQLLQNIRTHIAQQAEQQQPKECDPKIAPCNVPDKKEADVDDSEEQVSPVSPDASTPFRFRGRQRNVAQAKKDVAHAMAMKDRKLRMKKREKEADEPKKLGKKTKDKDYDAGDEPKKSKKIIKVEDDEPRKLYRRTWRDKYDDDKARTKRDEEEDEKSKKTREEEPEARRRKFPEKVKREFEYKEIPKYKMSKRKSDAEEKPLQEKRQKKHKYESEEEIVRFPEDIPIFSLASDSVESEQCKRHSRIYLRQLQRYKLWALMMYDATAKLPSGILQGNTNQYGDFDQCISVNATFKRQSRDGVSGIQGKYCLATIDVSSDSENAGLQHAIYRSQSFGFVRSKIDDPGHFIPRFSTINWGLCIPSVCKAEDLENSIKSSLDNYKKKSGISFDVKVEDTYCVTKEDLLSEYDMKTILTLLLYAAVITFAAYATLKDMSQKHKKITSKIPSDAEPQYQAKINENDKTNDFEFEKSNESLHDFE